MIIDIFNTGTLQSMELTTAALIYLYSGVKKKSGWDGCFAAAAAKSFQSCPTLRGPMDCSPPGSSVHGILQARVLEWIAIAFSNGWFRDGE